MDQKGTEPIVEDSPEDCQWQERLRDSGEMPRHIAVIPDGNGRWAINQGFSRFRGHRRGVEAVRDLVRASAQLDIEVVSLFVFSTENWKRPRAEVGALMSLLKEKLLTETRELGDNNVRVITSGRSDALPDAMHKALLNTVEVTASNTGLILNLAINYGGRAEIVDAVARIVADGVAAEDVTEELISSYAYHPELPNPDLLIRASGEQRNSNFLLWQTTYTEVVVTDVLWPDFSREDLYLAISEFQRRERRFGKTGAQLVAQAKVS